MPAPTTTAVGRALEERVARALRALPWNRPVVLNLVLKDSNGNRSEVDVAYGPTWRRRFVECKAYHGSGAAVGLEEVAKFKAVLALNGISARRGLFITTSTLSPRAGTIGVRTLDGVQLGAWERRLRAQGVALRVAGLTGRVVAAGCVLAILSIALSPLVGEEVARYPASAHVHKALLEQRHAWMSGWDAGWGGGSGPRGTSVQSWRVWEQLWRRAPHPPAPQQEMLAHGIARALGGAVREAARVARVVWDEATRQRGA